MTAHPDWDAGYAASTPPPWDIGRPQPAFLRLADAGLLAGRVLDAGCGTGEHALLAAARGADAVGVDVSPTAIERARAKAAERGLSARFEVADALDLGRLGITFDTVIDSGLFHVFGDEERPRYVASMASVLRPGGVCFLMCFSDRPLQGLLSCLAGHGWKRSA
jgi:cyclopropane fatty-acyl-phospholipid synthase-like methyltransferase